jgi:hypothetical protein
MRPQQAVRSSLRRVDAGRTLPRAAVTDLGNVTTDRALKPGATRKPPPVPGYRPARWSPTRWPSECIYTRADS